MAIISTGDELVPVDKPLQAGQIRDVNAPMLAAAVTAAGGSPEPRGIIQDEQVAIQAAVEAAILDCDMLLISGGTSVGIKDAIPAVISELGELLVHGVAAKPGKPTILGEIRGKPVFGPARQPGSRLFHVPDLCPPAVAEHAGRANRGSHTKRPRWRTRSLPTTGVRNSYLCA